MKKILFGLALLFPIIILAAAVETPEESSGNDQMFPHSGIDFEASVVKITGPTDPEVPAFCRGELISGTQKTFTFHEMGIDDEGLIDISFGEWSDDDKEQGCFQTAGLYSVSIDIFDLAGNALEIPDQAFTIVSADPDPIATDFTVDCPGGTVANATDFCEVTLELKDKFSNPVEQTMDSVNLSTDDGDNFFDDEGNMATKFYEGLRMNDKALAGNPFPLTWAGFSAPPFKLSAIAPSIREITTAVGGAFLSQVVPRPIEFLIKNLTKINLDGTRDETPDGKFDFVEFIPANLTFGVPVEIMPGFKEDSIKLDDFVTIKGTSFLGTTHLGHVESLLKSVSDHLFVDPAAVDVEGDPLPPESIEETLIFPEIYNEETIFLPKKTVGIVDVYDVPKNISLTATAKYSLEDLDVEYVAGAVGELLVEDLMSQGIDPKTPGTIVGWNTDNVGFKNIGISVEGLIIGDQSQMFLVDGEDGKMTTISGYQSLDVRKAIVKNAYQLIRNASNIVETPGPFSWDLFEDGKDVVVVDLSKTSDDDSATLTLAGPFPGDLGQKTLIVLNGNVIITEDLEYNSPATDSFGLILLRDKAGAEPVRGNIFVRSNVQKISGTLFADGGFFSGASPDIEEANTDGGGDRSNQLRLTGSLLSRNTIGGSRRTDEATGKFFSPWGTVELPLAKRYDLHHVRQYEPGLGDCVEDAGGCDDNKSAFILRLDQKATVFPPPGFTTK